MTDTEKQVLLIKQHIKALDEEVQKIHNVLKAHGLKITPKNQLAETKLESKPL